MISTRRQYLFSDLETQKRIVRNLREAVSNYEATYNITKLYSDLKQWRDCISKWELASAKHARIKADVYGNKR